MRRNDDESSNPPVPFYPSEIMASSKVVKPAFLKPVFVPLLEGGNRWLVMDKIQILCLISKISQHLRKRLTHTEVQLVSWDQRLMLLTGLGGQWGVYIIYIYIEFIHTTYNAYINTL